MNGTFFAKIFFCLVSIQCGVCEIRYFWLDTISSVFRSVHQGQGLIRVEKDKMKIASHPSFSLNKDVGKAAGKASNVRADEFSDHLQVHMMVQAQKASKAAPSVPDTSAPVDAVLQERYTLLGVVDHEKPTVSHVLMDSKYRAECWQIIHSDRNRVKPYTRIPVGTPVYFDPLTRDLSWGKKLADADGEGVPSETPAPCDPSNAVQDVSEAGNPGADLLSAVSRHMGQTYENLDCYELLVEGLKQMGVRYHGSNGLKNSLMDMARSRGLAENTFLSGEGVLAAVGQRVHTEKIADPSDNMSEQRLRLCRRLFPLLDSGHIFSFSTPTSGHTGVISKKNGNWTYINSGRIDHSVSGRSQVRKGVGEEDLASEIDNWLRRAARRGEPLYISTGSLNPRRLAAFYDDRRLEPL